jgi:hypothetical protein
VFLDGIKMKYQINKQRYGKPGAWTAWRFVATTPEGKEVKANSFEDLVWDLGVDGMQREPEFINGPANSIPGQRSRPVITKKDAELGYLIQYMMLNDKELRALNREADHVNLIGSQLRDSEF